MDFSKAVLKIIEIAIKVNEFYQKIKGVYNRFAIKINKYIDEFKKIIDKIKSLIAKGQAYIASAIAWVDAKIRKVVKNITDIIDAATSKINSLFDSITEWYDNTVLNIKISVIKATYAKMGFTVSTAEAKPLADAIPSQPISSIMPKIAIELPLPQLPSVQDFVNMNTNINIDSYLRDFYLSIPPLQKLPLL